MTTAQWLNWLIRLVSTILVPIATVVKEPYKTGMQMLAAGLFGMTIPSPAQIANGKLSSNGTNK